jgi:hypothetical protein
MSAPKRLTPKEFGGNNVTRSTANAPIFQSVWWKIIKEGRWKKHDWIIKLDPDAVMIAERMRGSLSSGWHRQGAGNPKGAYVVNCVYGLYGSIEVLSKNALATMATDMWRCPSAWVIPQEDVWLRNCLNDIDVWPQDNFGGFCMHGCDQTASQAIIASGSPTPELKYLCVEPFYACTGIHAEWHPFKTQDAIRNCINTARAVAPW